MFLKSLTVSIVAVALSLTSAADAALNAYLSLSGKKLGNIQGSVTQKGREGKIMVIAVGHEVQQAGSMRKHGVFTITKELDKSSPLLHQAMSNSETFTNFELQFWTPQMGGALGGGGTEVQHYTVRLTGARIQSIKFVMQNNKDPQLTRYAESEEISFAYDKIEWIWTAGGITATDEARF